jgi:hypothetical protein
MALAGGPLCYLMEREICKKRGRILETPAAAAAASVPWAAVITTRWVVSAGRKEKGAHIEIEIEIARG